MKPSFAILLFVLFITVLGIGQVKVSLSPFSIHFGKPYQVLGILLITVGIVLIKHQSEVDLHKLIMEQLEIEEKNTTDLTQNNIAIRKSKIENQNASI